MVKVVAVQGSSFKKQELFSATTRTLVARFFRAKQPPAYIHDSMVSARYTFTISGLYYMVLRGQPWAKSVDLLMERTNLPINGGFECQTCGCVLNASVPTAMQCFSVWRCLASNPPPPPPPPPTPMQSE